MKQEIIIRLPRVTPTFYEPEALSLLLCDFVASVGGHAWAAWEGNGVKIRVHDLSRKQLRVGLDFLCASTVQSHASMVLLETYAKWDPFPVSANGIPWGTVLREPRLTRLLFFTLPPGAFVVSRRLRHGRSVFAVRVDENRETTWRRAVSLRAVGQTCYVAWSLEQFTEQRLMWLQVLEDPDLAWLLL